MRVIVTRPVEDAISLVAALRARRLEAVSLPLLDIAALPDLGHLHAAWFRRDTHAAWMFVSGAAARHFFAARPSGISDLRSLPQMWAPGPGTAAVLEALGVPADGILQPDASSARFDSEALWEVVGCQPLMNSCVLIVRGAEQASRAAHAEAVADSLEGSGRSWLADQLRAAGAEVEYLAAYERRATVFDASQRNDAASAAGDGSVWLFNNARAVLHLRSALPHVDWSSACAVGTHPRIAQAARQAGFGVVLTSRPGSEDIIAAIESFE